MLVTEPEDREGYKGRLFWAKAGDLIYSKIRVKQGSLTIIPEDVASIAVSAEYPVYLVKQEVALAEYLNLVLRCAAFQRMLDGLSHGGSSKTRIHPDQFEALEVPLPSLDQQRAIVRRWQEAQAAAQAALLEADRLEQEAARDFLHGLGLAAPDEVRRRKAFAVNWSEFERWGAESNRLGMCGGRLEDSAYPLVEGYDCIKEIIHGCSASPSPVPTSLEILKISAVTRGMLDLSERKYFPENARFREQFSLRAGDVLLCRTNGTLAYVGQTALVEQDIDGLIFPDKLIRVRLRENIHPAYFWWILKTPPLRSQIEAAARTAVGNHAIGGRDIWRLRIPLPPLPIQQELVQVMETARRRAAARREEAAALQMQAKKEVEAMLLGDVA